MSPFDRLLRRVVSLTTVAAIILLTLGSVLLVGAAVFAVLRPLFVPRSALEDIFLALTLGVVAVGVADLALTIYQEELERRSDVRNPVLSAGIVGRFLLVIVTTLGIHSLLTVIRSEVQGDLQRFTVAVGLTIATAILVFATTYFIQRNDH